MEGDDLPPSQGEGLSITIAHHAGHISTYGLYRIKLRSMERVASFQGWRCKVTGIQDPVKLDVALDGLALALSFLVKW